MSYVGYNRGWGTDFSRNYYQDKNEQTIIFLTAFFFFSTMFLKRNQAKLMIHELSFRPWIEAMAFTVSIMASFAKLCPETLNFDRHELPLIIELNRIAFVMCSLIERFVSFQIHVKSPILSITCDVYTVLYRAVFN